MAKLKLIKNYIFKLLRKCSAIIFGTILLFLLPLIIIITSPIHLVMRFLVVQLAKRTRPDFGKIITRMGAPFGSFDMYNSKPGGNIVISTVLDGKVELDTWLKLINIPLVETVGENGEYKYPELRQSLFNWMGFQFWKWDDKFDAKNHVKLLSPEKFTPEDAKKMKESLITKSYGLNRSPWEYVLVQNYVDSQFNNNPGPKSLMYFRCSHALCDGFSMLKMFLMLVRTPESLKELEELKKTHTENKKQSVNYFKEIGRIIKLPYETALFIIETYSLKPWGVWPTEIKQEYHCITSERISNDYIKSIKNGHNVAFTSVLMECVTAGLRKTMQVRKGLNRVPEFRHSAIVIPVPGHPDKLRNHAVFGFAKLPVGQPDAVKRLQTCHRHLMSAKESAFPVLVRAVALCLGGLNRWTLQNCQRNNYNGVAITSFPGPKTIIRFGEHETLDASALVGSVENGIGIIFCILSYIGGIRFTLTVDKAIFPEESQAQLIMDAIVQELDVLQQALM